MRRAAEKRRREPTIALINIVFLMLIFFLVAGTVAPPLARQVTLIRTAEMSATPPGDALVVDADGRLSHRNRPVADAAGYLASLPQDARTSVKIVPDRDLPAQSLIALGRSLREAGAERIAIVAEWQPR